MCEQIVFFFHHLPCDFDCVLLQLQQQQLWCYEYWSCTLSKTRQTQSHRMQLNLKREFASWTIECCRIFAIDATKNIKNIWIFSRCGISVRWMLESSNCSLKRITQNQQKRIAPVKVKTWNERPACITLLVCARVFFRQSNMRVLKTNQLNFHMNE